MFTKQIKVKGLLIMLFLVFTIFGTTVSETLAKVRPPAPDQNPILFLTPRSQLTLLLRGGELVSVEQIELRPQRNTQQSINYTAQSHRGSYWGFYDDGTFLFIPSDATDQGSWSRGTWQQTQNGVITFTAGRQSQTTVGNTTFGMQGQIGQDNGGNIIAYIVEEASQVTVARVNGQNFGSNSYKYIEFSMQLHSGQ